MPFIGKVFIPTSHAGHKTPKCPNCNNPKDVKEVCRQCGYEYPVEGDDLRALKAFLIVGCVFAGLIWFAATTYDWLWSHDRKPLFDVLKSQWHWLTSIRLW